MNCVIRDQYRNKKGVQLIRDSQKRQSAHTYRERETHTKSRERERGFWIGEDALSYSNNSPPVILLAAGECLCYSLGALSISNFHHLFLLIYTYSFSFVYRSLLFSIS